MSEALAEAAKAELRKVAEEDAAAAAAAEEEASKDGGVTGVTSKGNAAVKLAPGSTATPQQANIIEQLVNATGASARALEDAAAAGGENDVVGSIQADKETEALKTRLREAIKEKHDVAVRAREATERVAVLEPVGLPQPRARRLRLAHEASSASAAGSPSWVGSASSLRR